jgi:hypothetical protein
MNKIARSNRRRHLPSVQLVHDRAWQRRGGSNGNLGQSASNQRLIERLEAENAKLRDSVMELVLQIQALRDALDHPQSEIQPQLT